MSSAQIDIPISKYQNPSGRWFIPEPISFWLCKHEIYADMRYCGTSANGDGYTDGVPNTTHHYILQDITEAECLLFKIQFPECNIHYFE
jgi:hypothetical protein